MVTTSNNLASRRFWFMFATLIAVALTLGTYLGFDAAGERMGQRAWRVFPDFEDYFHWVTLADLNPGYVLVVGGGILVLVGGMHFVLKNMWMTLGRVTWVILLLGIFWLMEACANLGFVLGSSDLSFDNYFIHDKGLFLSIGACFFIGISLGLRRRIQHRKDGGAPQG